MAAVHRSTNLLARAGRANVQCPFTRSMPRANVSRRKTFVKASLEPSSVIAVTQQALAYAICLGAEGVYTRTQMAEDAPGRPEVIPTAAGVVGTVMAVALVSSGSLDFAGLGVGLAVSCALLLYNIKRLIDTKHDPQFWPGPKAWPAGMALISFFALNVFLQGLRSDFSF